MVVVVLGETEAPGIVLLCVAVLPKNEIRKRGISRYAGVFITNHRSRPATYVSETVTQKTWKYTDGTMVISTSSFSFSLPKWSCLGFETMPSRCQALNTRSSRMVNAVGWYSRGSTPVWIGRRIFLPSQQFYRVVSAWLIFVCVTNTEVVAPSKK